MSAPTSVHARWILTAESPPIRDGLLLTDRGRIVFVGPAPAGDASTALENVVVMPAFVNAHTHLEFSSLPQPLAPPGTPFPDWIRRVIAGRSERDRDGENLTRHRAAIRAGLLESRQAGTGALGEIATAEFSLEELYAANMPGVVFLELIGLSPERIGPHLQRAENFLDANSAGDSVVRVGISPHAPYTVHPDLLAELVQLSADRRVPLAMHLAETIAEIQLLDDGSGPLRTLLEELGAWMPSAFRPGTRPIDYLRQLVQAHHALVIHGNYFLVNEWRYLGEHRDRLTLVYCPRTHAYFRHIPYPLRQLLACGARIALGTDSRASNPDLNMLEETRVVASEFPDISPQEILKMATINGATALRLDHELGSLRVGKQAHFVKLQLPPGRESDPYSWMI